MYKIFTKKGYPPVKKFASEFADGSKVLDVGTGGGFPGIPLAILFPEVNFVLVDSIGKKIKVVKEVAAALFRASLAFCKAKRNCCGTF